MGHLRPPRRLAPADLKGAALDYLDRFAAPRARLRQVMLRKIRNSVRHHGDDPAPLIAALDEALQWLEASGFLSDRAYAEARARSLSPDLGIRSVLGARPYRRRIRPLRRRWRFLAADNRTLVTGVGQALGRLDACVE
ncbi:MAG: hypothetical protein HC861_08230 [Rhodospirillaceae bacterium]|nr:hypothetical protein [Rhodospirillaceae bacterium]